MMFAYAKQQWLSGHDRFCCYATSHKYKIARSNSGNKNSATVVLHTVEKYIFLYKKTISFLGENSISMFQP